MKKIFISLLGLAGYTPITGIRRVSYSFDNSLKEKFASLEKQEYPNMLPLVIENFKDYEHICIYTERAKEIQQKILDLEKIDFKIGINGIAIPIDKETDQSYFLKQLNKIIEGDYDRIILDVSHGFRHMPILSILSLFNQNVKNQEKIEHIFFTKEIVPIKEYEIIDLKDNFEVINFSFLLSSFNNNYTVPLNLQFKNIYYQELAYKLSKFSEYFTSNLKQLLESSLIDEIIVNAKSIVDTDLETVNSDILILIDNMKYLYSLREKSEWIRFYEFSKLMNSINNQLNAVMFLYDAVGFYCLDSLKKIDNISKYIEKYEEKIELNNHKNTLYRLINDTKNIIKLGTRMHSSSFMSIDREVIDKYLENIPQISDFQKLIMEIESLRNKMVHSSVSQIAVSYTKQKYLYLLHKFKTLCIEEDVLSSIKRNETYLHAIKIKNYFSIKDMQIEDLKGKKEIYLVGENGDGKTVLLQAIALALKGQGKNYTKLAYDYIEEIEEEMELLTIDEKFPLEYRGYKNVQNLFAYGINRNKIGHSEEDTKETSYSGLFDTPSIYKTTLLKDAEKFLLREDNLVNQFKEKIAFLMDEKFQITRTDEGTLKYGEIKQFSMLSEGYKTTLIWLSDLLSRMMENDKENEIKKLEDFKAIVLIDEVDLYLHPKWKYDFMNKLRKIFPNIQFIMTTHSLVTILGASEDAVFYKVYKEDGETKITGQIDDISYYTSNILLTSPIFNLDSMKARGFKKDEPLSSDDFIYREIHTSIKEYMKENPSLLNDELKQKVKAELKERLAKLRKK